MALDNAPKAWDDAEAKTDVIGAQTFQLYANLLLTKLTSPGTRLQRHRPTQSPGKTSRVRYTSLKDARLGSLSWTV